MIRSSRRARLVGLIAAVLTSIGLPAGTAAAKPLLQERHHDEGSLILEDFCGLEGELAFVVDVKVVANQHGRDRYAYFLEHFTETLVFTNLANSESVTIFSKAVNHDLHVTDNGDGTLKILAIGSGNEVIYDSEGTVLGRNPGQVQVEIHVDHAGTPSDPFDDTFLGQEVVRPSTGRNDDLCAAMLRELT